MSLPSTSLSPFLSSPSLQEILNASDIKNLPGPSNVSQEQASASSVDDSVNNIEMNKSDSTISKRITNSPCYMTPQSMMMPQLPQPQPVVLLSPPMVSQAQTNNYPDQMMSKSMMMQSNMMMAGPSVPQQPMMRPKNRIGGPFNMMRPRNMIGGLSNMMRPRNISLSPMQPLNSPIQFQSHKTKPIGQQRFQKSNHECFSSESNSPKFHPVTQPKSPPVTHPKSPPKKTPPKIPPTTYPTTYPRTRPLTRSMTRSTTCSKTPPKDNTQIIEGVTSMPKKRAEIMSESQEDVLELPIIVLRQLGNWAGVGLEKCLGYFGPTDEDHKGRPVYTTINDYAHCDRYLYSQENGTWAVNHTVGVRWPLLRSTTAAVSPHLCQHWEYLYDIRKYKPGGIHIDKTQIRLKSKKISEDL